MVLFYYKQAEAEHEEKYFMALEKKEKMEEKMDSVMEVEVKLFKCKQVSGVRVLSCVLVWNKETHTHGSNILRKMKLAGFLKAVF